MSRERDSSGDLIEIDEARSRTMADSMIVDNSKGRSVDVAIPIALIGLEKVKHIKQIRKGLLSIWIRPKARKWEVSRSGCSSKNCPLANYCK